MTPGCTGYVVASRLLHQKTRTGTAQTAEKLEWEGSAVEARSEEEKENVQCDGTL